MEATHSSSLCMLRLRVRSGQICVKRWTENERQKSWMERRGRKLKREGLWERGGRCFQVWPTWSLTRYRLSEWNTAMGLSETRPSLYHGNVDICSFRFRQVDFYSIVHKNCSQTASHHPRKMTRIAAYRAGQTRTKFILAGQLIARRLPAVGGTGK